MSPPIQNKLMSRPIGRPSKTTIADQISMAGSWYENNWHRFLGKELDLSISIDIWILDAAKRAIGSGGAKLFSWAADVLEWQLKRDYQDDFVKAERALKVDNRHLNGIWVVFFRAWSQALNDVEGIVDPSEDAPVFSTIQRNRLLKLKPKFSKVIRQALDNPNLPDDEARRYRNAWNDEAASNDLIPWPTEKRRTVTDAVFEIWGLPQTSRGRGESMRHRLGFNSINFGLRTNIAFVYAPKPKAISK